MKIQAKLYRYYQKRGLAVLASCVLLSSGIGSIVLAESNPVKNPTKPASIKTARANIKAGQESIEDQDTNSVYVVSNSEVQTFNNLSDVIEENNVLKEQRQVLLDHSRLLRDKYKRLYEYCSKTPASCPEIKNDLSPVTVSNDQVIQFEAKISKLEQERAVLEAGISKAKEDLKAKNEEVASFKNDKVDITSSNDELLKTASNQIKEREKKILEKDAELIAVREEIKAKNAELALIKNEKIESSLSNDKLLKQVNGQIKDRENAISEKDKELAKKNEEIAKLQAEIDQKTKSEKSCMEQVETSSAVIMRIPELEGEILSLRNQLLIKKTTAELLGVKVGVVPNTKENSSAAPQGINKTRIAPLPVREESVDLGADVAIVEVVGNKVSLRVGPGASNSSLMDVQKGTRLTVEAREGEWLRVNAPTGGRAYINANYVRTFDKNGVLLSEAKMSEPDNLFQDDFSMNIDTPDSVKPPIPQKAPKKVSKRNLGKNFEPFGKETGAESVAMDKLLKAMNQPEKK